jgi:hypothetical protein
VFTDQASKQESLYRSAVGLIEKMLMMVNFSSFLEDGILFKQVKKY